MSKILIVDDEEYNLCILEQSLVAAKHTTLLATGGKQAIDVLKQHKGVDLVILDRMMPDVSGMDVLQWIKSNPKLRHVPVIMQTAAAMPDQVLEGIKAGVYYYLAKPYSIDMMLGIVESALRERSISAHASEHLKKFSQAISMMHNASFHFRSMEEAESLSYLVSNCFPKPAQVVLGVIELAFNAVEHGNLGIDYNEKKQLLLRHELRNEINRRLAMKEYRDRTAVMTVEVTPGCYNLTIEDSGEGFNYAKYLEIDPERMADPNGRGIPIIAKTAFDELEYVGKGNKVICRIRHQQAA